MTRRDHFKDQVKDTAQRVAGKAGEMAEPVLSLMFRYARKIPFVQKRVDQQLEEVMAGIDASIRPYADLTKTHETLPPTGVGREEVLEVLRELAQREESRWRDGFVSGAVYHGDPSHIEFLNEAYAITSQTNPLHSDLWPSVVKYEAEIVSMTANMLGARQAGAGKARSEGVCGVVSSGGTESILLAMKAYRDRAQAERGITRPNMVVPTTAHAAFDKASRYFGIELVKVPVGEDLRADVEATRRAINRNTIVVVGSAPSFPHGLIDPIGELSELAHERGVGFHTDACLGGFVLPWAERLGHPVPAFDFRLPGVTSMSVDTHKYGYAAKGTSVVLYRGFGLRHHQYYSVEDWPGGLYFSPTFAGSRPGALSAACWAALVSTGEGGYLEATGKILDTAGRIRAGIESIDGISVLGDPLWVIAFASDDPAALDIYRVMDFMTARHWNLNGLHRPPCVHIATTLRHTQPGVAERFVDDLREAVEHVETHPESEGGMAPVYGMAATIPVRGLVSQVLEGYLDRLYEP